MLKKVLPLFLSITCLFGTEVFAQPSGNAQSGNSGVSLSLGAPADIGECLELDADGNAISSGVACGGGASQLTDLSDVTAKSGNSTTVTMGSGPFTSGTCAQWDANGNIVTTGSPCSAGAATTEAALEAQLTDVTDVFTNNDGALTDDDLSDNVLADLSDVTAKSGNTTVVATVAGAFTPGDCLEIDASGNIVGTGAACSTATGDITNVGNCATGDCFSGTTGNIITGASTLELAAATGAVGVNTGISSEIFYVGGPTKFVRYFSNNTQVRQNGHKVFSNANAGVQKICGGIGDNVANGACLSIESDGAGGGTELQLASTGGSSFRVRDGAFGLKLEIDTAGVKVQDDAYGPGWNTSTVVPTKNAVYDEMETKADTVHTHTETDITDLAHTTDAADLTTGVLADARVQQSNVTQHQAALSITESQISDLSHTVLATTEAAMETQLTDVTNLFTNNDGALADDDLTDNVITDLSDITAKSGNTTVVATTSGALISGNCLEADASGNIVDAGAACGTGGAGSNALITYYNHNFTWPGGSTTTLTPLSTQTITHNVGRPPDSVKVFKKNANGWYEHYDLWETAAGTDFGYRIVDDGIDENNVTKVLLYTNHEAVAGDALIRLFWYSDDNVETAVDGRVDISTSQGTSIVTGTEVLTGDTADGAAVYAKRIAFGALPNTTTKNVAHGITWNEIEEYYCRAIANTGERMMMQSFPGPNARMLLDATNISIITTTDLSLYTADCTIKYTK